MASQRRRKRTKRPAKFTPIESAMLAVLSDGRGHTPRELHACLNDTLSPLSNVRFHLSSIRRKIRPTGKDVECTLANGSTFYRLVRRPAAPRNSQTPV